AQPVEQLRRVRRKQDPMQVRVDLALLFRPALGDREQGQVVVAEQDDAVVAQRMHEPQRLQRLAATVDQVAAEPQRVARRVEADALQQQLRRRMTYLHVADRPVNLVDWLTGNSW